VGVKIDYPEPAVFNQTLGIVAGRYQAPNFTFIFPENLGIGTPPVPSNFGDLAFLRNGSGPWNGASNQFIGQLNPWPDATAPEVSCTASGTPPPPSATAVAAFSPSPGPVATGTTVTLDATGSTPTSGPFLWTQTSGPAVTLTNASSMQATFVAPSLSAQTNLTFQVSVGGSNSTTPATASVTVPVAAAPVTNPPTVSATSSPANPVVSASAVTLSATGIDPAGGALTYTWTAPAGITLTPVAGTNGAQQTFTAPTVPAGTAATSFAFSVTATSTVAPNLTSTAATVNVVVNPATDTVTITNATYRINKATLTVAATDTTPGVTLTCTLNEINQATGKPWTATMTPAGGGTFNATFPNISAPSQVTVTSSAGGSASSPVTNVRQ
jgi:large repetitive protein